MRAIGDCTLQNADLRVAGGLVSIALALPSLLTAQVTADTPGCSRLDIPERVAAITDLLDVARLSAGLAQRGIGVDPVHALVSVRFDEDGAPQHVRVLASSVDSATDLGVRDAVAGAVVSQPSADPWGIRVMLVLGDAPSIQFERAELCPPEPVEREPRVVVEEIIAVPADELDDIRDRLRGTRVRVLVGEDGRVARTTIVESSGDVSRDQKFLWHWRNQRFHPATLDGLPIRAWYEPGADERDR